MTDSQDEFEEISKSQKKREANALQELGERLLTLSDKQLKEIDLPEGLADAVKLAKTIKSHSGLKRQLQYIGKVMRSIDAEPIETFFASLDDKHHDANKAFHQLERWRDRLLLEGNDALGPLMEEFPEVDLQRMRQLMRNANNPKNEKTSTRAKREIFQYLKQLKSTD
ncbi:MAG: ribosome biogenesis factor YjgA [Gammaproteobacteria bacterium]|nr:ribosome biogenesis factor YjgA [Gammaproteobacteria bacterium]